MCSPLSVASTGAAIAPLDPPPGSSMVRAASVSKAQAKRVPRFMVLLPWGLLPPGLLLEPAQ